MEDTGEVNWLVSDALRMEVPIPVLTWLANRGVTVALSRANPSTTALLAHYHLLELIGEKRLYPTNRHAIAAFRRETGQATPETAAE